MPNCTKVTLSLALYLFCVKFQVALQHVDGILLEGENGTIVQHTQQGDKPESARGKYLSKVLDAERVVFFLGFTCLGIEFLVHHKVDNGHDEGNA